MEYSIQDFLADVPPRIFDRGEDYYHRDMVRKLEKRDGCYTAKVSGSESYRVDIHLTDGGAVADWGCTCPYDVGDVCKHVVAVLLAIAAGEAKATCSASVQADAKGERTPSRLGPEELLEQATKEQLAVLLLNQCREDERFCAKVMAALETSPQRELDAIQAFVKASIRSNTRRGYIDEWACDRICVDMDEMLETAQMRMEQGTYPQAVDIALFLLITAMKLASTADSSSGGLSVTVAQISELLEECALAAVENGAPPALRKVLLDKLLHTAQNKVFDGWESQRYELVRCAAHLATPGDSKKLYTVLDQWLGRLTQEDSYYGDALRPEDKYTRYCITLAAEGSTVARAYLEQNLEDNNIRLLAVQEDMKQGDFANACHLCSEKVEAEPPHGSPYQRPSKWNYLLYEIYQRWGKPEEALAQARRLLLLGDMSYYEIVKRLLMESGRWLEEYTNLLAEVRVRRPYHEYMEILASEGELDLLMHQVRQHPEMVFQYGKHLAAHYPQEIYLLCAADIRGQAAQATNRSAYRKLCSRIWELARFGGMAEAEVLTEELAQAYPRRPALLEELGKVRRKLTLDGQNKNR